MTKREIESGRVDIRLLRVGSPCHAPTYPALYKTSTEKHEKNIREIFENVNRQSYPSEVYLKLSTDNLTQLCSKHQQRNMKKTSEKYLKFSTDNHDIMWDFDFLYFWPKSCQYRLYLISRFPELFICESLQSWPTDQRGPSFSYISFTFTKTKFFLLILDFYQFTQGLKNTPILPIYWC